jgi:hypothetical protein
MRSPIQPFIVLIWNLSQPFSTIRPRNRIDSANRYGMRSRSRPRKRFTESALGKLTPWIAWLMMVFGRSSDR